MSRNSVVVPPKKTSAKSKKKHDLSSALRADSRVQGAPRHVAVVHQQPLEGGELVYMVKIYAGPGEPGSELMTLSTVDSARGHEVELRFDEKFPISIRFKKQSDDERVAYACEQITRAGGYEKLLESVRSSFPKFGV